MKSILAVYENGVFKPTEPVDLPEHSQVRVEPVAEASKSGKAQTAADLMKFAGTVKWPEDALKYQKRIREEW